MKRKTTNFLLVGVGGQGILLAADVIALVGLESGLDVKKSEVHGMAQRGGSVTSHVRWGEQVFSPLIAPGEVDYLIALERLEALRYVDHLRPEGTLLVNDYRIVPVAVSSGEHMYPSLEDEEKAYASLVGPKLYIPATSIAHELGQARASNVVILGALSSFLDVAEDTWLKVISERVPEHAVELNRQAFLAGRAYCNQHLPVKARRDA